MAKHRTHSIEFKRQVALDFIAGETLHGLAKRHDILRNLIRIWVKKLEAGAFDEDARSADLLFFAPTHLPVERPGWNRHVALIALYEIESPSRVANRPGLKSWCWGTTLGDSQHPASELRQSHEVFALPKCAPGGKSGLPLTARS